MIFDYATSREVVYFDNRIGSRIYVKAENRFGPAAHSIGATAQINNVAEFANYLSDNSNTFGYVEKKGLLAVTVWAGNIRYNATESTISDTNLTLPASQTNYIYLDYATLTIKQTINIGTVVSDGMLLATVITSASSVSSISYTKPLIDTFRGVDGTSITFDANGRIQAVVSGGGTQTLANTSDATSHTVTLSASGGSVKLAEGANITLTTTGTSSDGIVTIAATGGGGGGGDLLAANNLSDVANVVTARTNLGVAASVDTVLRTGNQTIAGIKQFSDLVSFINGATSTLGSFLGFNTFSVLETVISTAEIKNSFSVPVTILPAPGAGFANIIQGIEYRMVFNSAIYVTNLDVDVAYGFGGTIINSIPGALLLGKNSNTVLYINNIASNATINTVVQLYTNTGNTTI